MRSFSILERIVMGETQLRSAEARALFAFSILERIVMGETINALRASRFHPYQSFSILERIVMGETRPGSRCRRFRWPFSILERIVMGETSGGSGIAGDGAAFQYPRTDRDG